MGFYPLESLLTEICPYRHQRKPGISGAAHLGRIIRIYEYMYNIISAVNHSVPNGLDLCLYNIPFVNAFSVVPLLSGHVDISFTPGNQLNSQYGLLVE